MPDEKPQDGQGQQPQQPPKKPAHAFESDGEFLHAARKAVGKEVEASARASVMKELGIENPDEVELPKLAEMLKGSKRQISELERAQRDIATRDKSLSDLTAEVSSLREFKATTTKRDAITAAASKDVAPEMLDMVAAFLQPKLALDDKGNVVGADGSKLSELISGLLKDRPQLKRDAFKPGAGTSPVPPIVPSGGGNGNGAPKDKKPFGQSVVDELKSMGIDPEKLVHG